MRVGRAISLGLADAGYDLVISYHSSGGPASDVAHRIEAMGRRALTVRADLAAPDEIERIGEAVRREYGRLDLLVNNASVFWSTPFLEVGPEEWNRTMGVNLRGPYLLVRDVADLLEASKGSVVNIVDLSAWRPFRLHPHHSVSKAGLLQLTRVMAQALAPRVRVNAIAPGTVLPPDDATAEEIERDRERTALGRTGVPEDVVRTVLFLAGSPFITGEVVVVDGGRSLSP